MNIKIFIAITAVLSALNAKAQEGKVFGKVTDGMDVVLKLKVGDTIQSISVYPVEPTVLTENMLVTENAQ